MTRTEDRRRFFRIDDEVNLFYKKIDKESLTEISHVTDNILGNCSLSAALEAISQESALLLCRLERSHPDVVDYLKIIENKIDLLAQAFIMQSGQFREKDTRNANLSAAGLAFDSEEELKEGDYVEIKILLVSCMAIIVTYGKVIYCKKNRSSGSRYPYIVGVDYINMKDQDRELLIKHVVKRQLQQIRDKKEVSSKL
ncbi:MAG: PilZ domain-containing protein [Methylobacter sp.]|nr:PilZ domain-containing protein [Methylobacter sp.]